MSPSRMSTPFQDSSIHVCSMWLLPTLHPATNTRPQRPKWTPSISFLSPSLIFFWKCSTILLMVQNSGDHQLRFGSVNDICKRIVFLCLRGHPKGNIDLTSVFLSHFWTSWTSRNIAISWNRDTLNSPCFCQTIVVIGFLGPKSEKIRLNFPRNLHRIESRWRNSQKVD